MTNPIRPSAITQILRSSGYPVSKFYKGKIRGLTEHTTGVKSERGGDGSVRVYYLTDSILRLSAQEQITKREAIQQVLQDHGYIATLVEDMTPYVLVQRPEVA